MAKIRFDKWSGSLEYEKYPDGYKIKEVEYWKTISVHGRSRGQVKCPCCDTVSDIYIWSFMGGGKRCSGCNALLSHGGAFIKDSEITKGVLINETHIQKNGN